MPVIWEHVYSWSDKIKIVFFFLLPSFLTTLGNMSWVFGYIGFAEQVWASCLVIIPLITISVILFILNQKTKNLRLENTQYRMMCTLRVRIRLKGKYKQKGRFLRQCISHSYKHYDIKINGKIDIIHMIYRNDDW